jgi:predicted acetylornithine/succinylornithine family transaminase
VRHGPDAAVLIAFPAENVVQTACETGGMIPRGDPPKGAATMAAEEWIEDAQRYLMHTYTRFPLVLSKGRGTRVYSRDGREYLDFVAGVAVNNLGHCHPKVTVAIQKQAQRLVHTSNLYYTEPQTRLAKALVTHSFADKVFFCNSGAEANEAAVKLARKAARLAGPGDRYEIITTAGSFHGRTLAMISASGQPKLQAGYEPLLPGFVSVPYDDLGAVEKAITPKTIAVMVEPVQGEGGVRVPSREYLPGLRRLCDSRGLFLILDEVQTGIGRTGRLFAYEHAGIVPDIMTLAKGLGNGFPIGAMLATDQVAKAFTPGSHAATFGGNPLACAAALATIETILDDGYVLENCRRMGDRLVQGLRALQQKYPVINEVRGVGLLVGLALTVPAREIVAQCMQRGLLVNATADTVVRFVPPLIVTQEEVDQAVAVVDAVLAAQEGHG